jgi:hypothetical protein
MNVLRRRLRQISKDRYERRLLITRLTQLLAELDPKFEPHNHSYRRSARP